MTIQQESRRTMYQSATDYLEPNSEITKDLPEFVTNFNNFKITTTEINRISGVQNFDKTGLAKEKSQLQNVLILLVRENSLKLTSYANLNNNIPMFKEVKFTRSKLTQASDTLLRDYAQMVYDKAQENLANLSVYGITQETQSVLQNAINAYSISLARPRLGQNEISQATKQLVELFKNADILLGKIDSAINVVVSSHPTFYNGYTNVRKVIKTGTGTLILKGAASETNGSPIKGVTFTFVPNGEMQMEGNGARVEIVKKTARKGNFYIKNMPEGIYNVKVTKTGYKDKEVTVSVAPGELANLNVEMEKV
jgi:hypothetical protein